MRQLWLLNELDHPPLAKINCRKLEINFVYHDHIRILQSMKQNSITPVLIVREFSMKINSKNYKNYKREAGVH